MKIFLAGEIIPEERAMISARDHGFLFGIGLFETFRTFQGKPLLLPEHMERMRSGCQAFRIDSSATRFLAEGATYPLLRETLTSLLQVNDLRDAVFRYTVSAGEAPPGLPASPYSSPVELVLVRPLHPPLPSRGQRLHILNTKRSEPEAWPRPKSSHYANSLAAHWELRDRQVPAGDEGLMRTRDGRLAEGVVSNIFLIAEGKLATPSLDAGILGGVTRAAVLQLAQAAHIEAVEKDLALADLRKASAILTTNSTRGVLPVYEVIDADGSSFWSGDSAGNAVVRKLLASYAELVSHSC